METIPDKNGEQEGYFGLSPGWCLLLILLLAIFFRIFNITQTSLWTDELATYWVATAPNIEECIMRAGTTQGQSPFYYLAERAVLSVLPENEFSLRLLSFISSVFSVYLIFILSKMLFGEDRKALFAALIFSIHEVSVYYAQEARSYAPGFMFAILSMIYFLNMFRRNGRFDGILYVVFSICTLYCQYIFSSLFIVQNLYYFYFVFFRKPDIFPSPLKWIVFQVVLLLSYIPLLFQLSGMFQNRTGWDWLKQLDFFSALKMFVCIFDLKILFLLALCFAVFYAYEKINLKEELRRVPIEIIFLISWIIIHFIFIFAVSKILGVSLFDVRYMVFALIPFYILLPEFLFIFKTDVLRVAFPSFFLVIYLGLVSMQNYISYGHFSYRIPHNWRSSITLVNKNYKAGDVILLRAGFVNEDWIPFTENKIVQDYVKCPFQSFYWKKKKGLPKPTIYSLTYTWDKQFYPYYDKIFDKIKNYERIWIIGVNTPNTNYPISNISALVEKEFLFKKIYEANYSGVYLCLFSANPYLETINF